MTCRSDGEVRRRKAYRIRKAARDKAAYETAMSTLRAAAKACAICEHYRRRRLERDGICTLHSDFYGDAIVNGLHLCPDFKDRQP